MTDLELFVGLLVRAGQPFSFDFTDGDPVAFVAVCTQTWIFDDEGALAEIHTKTPEVQGA